MDSALTAPLAGDCSKTTGTSGTHDACFNYTEQVWGEGVHVTYSVDSATQRKHGHTELTARLTPGDFSRFCS